MNEDLRRDLAVLGAELAGDGAVPLAAVLRRIRRRRAVRTTTYGAVGVGTAAAVAFGAVTGFGMAPQEVPPVPPATQRPTPDPTPTPVPTPSPTPSPSLPPAAPVELIGKDGDGTPDWTRCGAATGWVDARHARPEGFDVVLDGPRERHVGEPLELTLRVTAEDAAPFTLRVDDLQAVVIPGDAVVGLGSAGSAEFRLTPPAAGVQLDVPLGGALLACSGAGEPGPDAHAPEDAYLLVVPYTVVLDDGQELYGTGIWEVMLFDTVKEPSSGETAPETPETPDVPDHEPSTQELVVGGTVDVRAPVMNNLTQSSGSAGMDDFGEVGTWCGKPLSTVPGTPDSPVTLTGTGFLEGDSLTVRLTATNNGAPLVDAELQSPTVNVLRDGLVISQAYERTARYLVPGVWPTGTSVSLEMPVGRWTCTFSGGDFWTAGTYQIQTQGTVLVPAQPAHPAGRLDQVNGGPGDFTLP